MSGLVDPLLAAPAPRHGFALRDTEAPPDALRPVQVHGAAVARAADCRGPRPAPEADAIVSAEPGVAVAVVTADCVPVLLAAPGGGAVAAVHAGWRGLAAGVVAAGVAALVDAAGAAPGTLVAAIGPHIGPCCYEVDDPVLDALRAGHSAALGRATRPTRPGHARLDLGEVARAALVRAGIDAGAIGRATVVCTACDPRGLPSYRRDGPRAGRIVHVVAARDEG